MPDIKEVFWESEHRDMPKGHKKQLHTYRKSKEERKNVKAEEEKCKQLVNASQMKGAYISAVFGLKIYPSENLALKDI